MNNILEFRNLVKKYKDFELNIPELNIPEGFSTALIGENGVGKSTLLSIAAGINLSFNGEIKYFGEYSSATPFVRENIGYTACNSYFMPYWKISETAKVCKLLFENFSEEKYQSFCKEFGLSDKDKKMSELSDGNKMRLMIASVLSRQTKLLLLDEPASPLDPVMRDKLCDLLREYLATGGSVLFSTHNISDMENVTDYAIIMSGGRVVEQGFVEDLKEKYISVKGENSCYEKAKDVLFSISNGNFGFEGICLSDNLNMLAGMDVKTERPTLHQISVAIMKSNGSK